MGFREKRKLIKAGPVSKALILPKPWLDYHGEDANVLTLLGNSILILAPKGYEKKAKRILELAEGSKK